MQLKSEDIKITSFEKETMNVISSSTDEEFSNIMKKYDYTYEKLKNEIFIPDWKKGKTTKLFGNETTTHILREIMDIMIKRNIITIKLAG